MIFIFLSSVNIVVTTKMYGYEVSWQLIRKDNKAVACSNGHYASDTTVSETCQLEKNVEYELVCEDEWGDGWNGGYIEIAGVKWCDTFLPDSPKVCEEYYSYGCNTQMSIKYFKVQGTIF